MILRAEVVDLVCVLPLSVVILVWLVLENLDTGVTVALGLAEMGHGVQLRHLVLHQE